MLAVLVEAEQSLQGELRREVGDGHRAGRVLAGRSRAQLLVVPEFNNLKFVYSLKKCD